METAPAAQYIRLHHLLGQGNFVLTCNHMKQGGDDRAFFDLFRFKGGKIVEHWDIQEKIGPKEPWNNAGKFRPAAHGRS